MAHLLSDRIENYTASSVTVKYFNPVTIHSYLFTFHLALRQISFRSLYDIGAARQAKKAPELGRALLR
ncbi:hypothetical protein KSF73_00805 [Burkholderiaceae bacterium DAT-1]|nr:hypothetical protein [Burkholderiaceae bacterium DAT-1]